MKRVTAFLLLLSLVLSGCGDRLKEPVTFYYIRSNYEEDMTAVIGSEQREASGHREDLSYLLALYLIGPADDELQSPLPRSCTMLSAKQTGDSVILNLSDTSDDLSDSQYTLACACLAMTCMELTDASYVTINSGDRSITMGEETLLLQDLTTAAITEETQ